MPLAIGVILLILAEISLYVTLGAAIGLLATLAVVLGSAVAGALIVRAQGRHVSQRLIDSVIQGQNPLHEAGHGVLKALAGVLLVLPGFLTDVMGLVLLVPPVREALMRKFVAEARRHAVDRAMEAMLHPHGARDRTGSAPAGDIVEGQAEEVPKDTTHPGHPASGWTRGPH